MVNGLGEPIDGLGKLGGDYPLDAQPPRINPLKKKPVTEPLDVGVRAINGLLTIGQGQRVGVGEGFEIIGGKAVQHLGTGTRSIACAN